MAKMRNVERKGMEPDRGGPGSDPEYLWFLDALVHVRVANGAGLDGISLLEFQAPFGTAPPLHVHHTQDEIFHVIEGEVTWRVGDEDVVCGAGDTLLAPKGIPHTYRVKSRDGARWLAVTSGGDFEGFVRALARPAERLDLPEPPGPPTPEAAEALVAAARGHSLEILGPPAN